MYAVAVETEFVAQHFLTVPDCDPENERHSHHYGLDVAFEGSELDDRGYLLDIEWIEEELERIESRYRDETLNDLPEFEGLNPSVEHFSRVVAESVAESIPTGRLDAITVTVSEDDVARAAYTHSP
ncbi:6-pyruvoyl trahydropterin synthase family protein [Natronorarus salvus]|uniref:6-pyruvoyl trahydropterin synthase family protein n=1 Tax=Natronorarus salvus TaxID=3117733 RepID=UPI002F265064